LLPQARTEATGFPEEVVMHERFTDRARKVMQLADQEAQRFNHEYIGTEHVLLGLVKEGEGVAANVLKNLDVDLRKVRREVEMIVQAGPDPVSSGERPRTPRAKKVLEWAAQEARAPGHEYVGTEHLLLGLVAVEEGIAAQVLKNLGLELGGVREEVLNLLGHNLDSGRRERHPPDPGDLPPRIAQAVKGLDALVELFTQMKEGAVAAQDFEWGAQLRDQTDKLVKMRSLLIKERHREAEVRPDHDRP